MNMALLFRSNVACMAMRIIYVCLVATYVTGLRICSVCPLNKYCPNNHDILDCPPNTRSGQGSILITNCSCSAGYTAELDGVACTACSAGSYKNAVGVGQCSPCPSGTSSANGSTSLDDCICMEGHNATSNGVACDLCEVYTFKSNTGIGACLVCLPGQISLDRIRDCSVCPPSSSWDTELLSCICDDDYSVEPVTFMCVVSEEMKSRQTGSHCGCG
jgi:Tyrosine-protein kinase ephrin type A/B receptor-like